MRGRQQSAFANPVLVGAVTVLAVMVAVFLAYNANQGLPFVPTRQLKVDIGDGSSLVAGNDVRLGGFRVGVLASMKPIQLASGQVGAELTLQLDQSQGQVPVDSTVSILPRSVLGLKYVALTKGPSSKVFADGGTLPIGQTNVPVQFDDIYKTFDTKTRSAIQQDLVGFGDALTARGSSLNDTIASLPRVLGHLEPVARYLSASGTGLTRFFDSLNRFFGAVAPVAQVNASLFTDMATTFEAISRDRNALEQTIALSPSTLDVGTDSLRAQRPFLSDFTTLGNALSPATAELNTALPTITPAIEVGTKTLARTPALNTKLQQFMEALKHLALAPGTNVALNALTSTVGILNPTIRYLGPFVTVCNDWNYWWTHLGEHLSEATRFGFSQRALVQFADALQPNNLGSIPASQPANGGNPQPGGAQEFLHGPPYGAAIDNSGNADCETGQRGYPKKLNSSRGADNVSGPYPRHENLVTDAHVPGNQGPTFNGRTHVPAGETFSRNPLTGPQIPANVNNYNP